MELQAFLATLRRRWPMTVGGLILAIAVTTALVARVGPSYKAEGSVLLFPPTSTVTKAGTNDSPGNPYLNLTGLNQARDIVIRSLQSKSVADSFAAREPNASYEVTPDYATSGPIVVIGVTSKSSEAAVRGLGVVIGTVSEILANMQSELDLKSGDYITSKVLTIDRSAQVMVSTQIRSTILISAVLLGTVLLAIALLDPILLARKARRLRPREASGTLPERSTRGGSRPRAAEGVPARRGSRHSEPEPDASQLNSESEPDASQLNSAGK
jgi:hypothetical protein